MRKKYIKYYNVINNKIYDDKNNEIINEELNKIIIKYKPPSHLHDIKLIAKNIKEADNGIVYIGLDSTNKKQYIYGINFVTNRKKNKIKTFLKVNQKIPDIERYIKKELDIFNKSDNPKISINTLFAVILLMEMNFFIRTGKKKYLNDNETIGLLTLQKSNFTFNNDKYIDILFKGKKKQLQQFTVDKENHKLLYKILKLLINNTEDFIFKTTDNILFSESKMYQMMKMFSISLKDIRTFGVNRILINELWKAMQLIDISYIKKNDIRRMITDVINKTANIIGHTPSISKKSYIVDELRSIITPDLFIYKDTSFKDFYNIIIKKLTESI
ncbi:DNA topoisomerase type I [Melanoplus sanguinipes entomopoxvirus]|uniref:DNA topoisomerase n=1 Tax=Melanoplus sanguinipes entomopoxvirus TaxID=83191 RepID=Q9YVW2_MSEPV|nr:DNA topoisomerase type I [Melanoplus sanguinipes entomopoxvirus]AAC97665.1 ORF MSV130 putative DNA topoisomerase I, Amsacta moorei entomopoxvirus topoisomerase (vaccinia H6R) homolog, similar to GB:U80056 [Melanoplus sanguinipes entomopoxvirus 'O']